MPKNSVQLLQEVVDKLGGQISQLTNVTQNQSKITYYLVDLIRVQRAANASNAIPTPAPEEYVLEDPGNVLLRSIDPTDTVV